MSLCNNHTNWNIIFKKGNSCRQIENIRNARYHLVDNTKKYYSLVKNNRFFFCKNSLVFLDGNTNTGSYYMESETLQATNELGLWTVMCPYVLKWRWKTRNSQRCPKTVQRRRLRTFNVDDRFMLSAVSYTHLRAHET